MNRFSILLVGAGNLGSRYLQGLSSISEKLRITVVDVSQASLNIAKERWNQVSTNRLDDLVFMKTLPNNSQTFDIVIVAASSSVRAEIVEQISQNHTVKYWVLEKVLAQSLHDLNRISNTLENAAGAWVNHSRRMMPWYQNLKPHMTSAKNFKVEKIGSNWNLACNAMHFIDLVSWWRETTLTELKLVSADRPWYESKRDGYFELDGTLKATYSDGSLLSLTNSHLQVSNTLTIELDNGNSWKIDESEGLASSSSDVVLNGTIEFQSQITAKLVMSILETGTCLLPTLNEAIPPHKAYISTLLNHWNESQNLTYQRVPIT